MAIVDKRQIEALTTAGKALSAMNSVGAAAPATGADGDWLAKTERVLTGINTLMENVTKLRQMPISPSAGVSGIASERERQFAPENHAAPEPKAISAPSQKESQMKEKMVQPVINKLCEYLDKCIAENPNMTLGEAIAKAPLNVTQARGLLELLSVLMR